MAKQGLFTKVDEMGPSDWEEYRDSHPEGSFTLLDVRQPKEYQRQHLPGALLIPLPELEERFDELDEQKPLVTYCASGHRSRAAAQFLTGRGFKPVSSLAGGMKAWEGPRAAGPLDWGLDLIRGSETPAAMLAVACGLEQSLRAVYEELAQGPLDEVAAALFKRLAGFELKHEEKVREMFQAASPGPSEEKAMARALRREYAEGGFTSGQLREMFSAQEQGLAQILDMAMTVEAQGLDLYLRLAQKSERTETRESLLEIGQDEKQHLRALGELRDAS